MDNTLRIVTQADLGGCGLSDYMVRQIVKGLNFSSKKRSLRFYETSDIVSAIKIKLANSRTRSMTREKLQYVLSWLKGESNVVRVDFLKNLSLDERAKTLQVRIEAADDRMRTGVLKEFEEVQKRVEVALAGSNRAR
jgi:transcriptional regulator NrdR family protein